MEQQLNMALYFMMQNLKVRVDTKLLYERLFLKAITLTEVKSLINRLVSDKFAVFDKAGHLSLTDLGIDHLQNKGYQSVGTNETNESTVYKEPNLFLSYCWGESEEAEKIYSDLAQVGIRVLKDNHQLQYKDSLSSFMHSIRDCDFAILLISDNYLKSKNCMNEVMELLKEKEYLKKVMPVIIGGTKIFKPIDRLNYIRYWEHQCTELSTELQDVSLINSVEVIQDLQHMTKISQLMGGFLTQLSDMLQVTLADLQKTGYHQLLEQMDFEDVTFAAALLAIARAKGNEQKEIMLDDYVRKGFPLNSYYYSIKAGANTDGRKYEQARINYLEAIRQNPRNAEAHNNLGLLYNDILKDREKAIIHFSIADELYPNFTIAKLNLAFVLAKNPETHARAAQINRDIIACDPDEPRAYNNLSNYLKLDFNKNFAECERLYFKAMKLDPDYVEPYLGYANLLKLVKRTEEGNLWYRKALKKDKTKYYKPIIQAALKSVKG